MELQYTVSTSTLQLLGANIGRTFATVKLTDSDDTGNPHRFVNLIQTMDCRWKPMRVMLNDTTLVPSFLRRCAWEMAKEIDAKLDAWIEEEEVWQELGFSNL